VTAAEALANAGLLGPEVRVLFHPIRPERLRLIPVPRGFVRLWGEKIKAVTLFRFIFMERSMFTGEPRSLGLLVIHEMTHVRQWVDGGVFGFTLPYITHYFRARLRGSKHWDAYRSNPFEVEARAMADRFRARA